MGRLTVEQIVTADGYAADESGGLDFFLATGAVGPADHDQLAFLENIDSILLGTNTYRMFAEYWPNVDAATEPVAEPINSLPKFVVSNSLQRAPWGDGDLEILRGDAADSVAALKERTSSIVVWGSLMLTDALFHAGLVDVLRLRIVPVLIGAGRSFTPPDLGERGLTLDHSVVHPSGHIDSTYLVS